VPLPVPTSTRAPTSTFREVITPSNGAVILWKDCVSSSRRTLERADSTIARLALRSPIA
jgi:hypothetical protein